MAMGDELRQRRGLRVLGCALGLLFAMEGSANVSQAEDEVFTYKDGNGVRHFTNVPADRRYRAFAAPREGMTVLRFRQDRRAAQAAGKPGKASPALKALIHATAVRFNLETALVHAMVRAESGFDPHAVSPAGARGLMQLMPGTAREVGVRDVSIPDRISRAARPISADCSTAITATCSSPWRPTMPGRRWSKNTRGFPPSRKPGNI